MKPIEKEKIPFINYAMVVVFYFIVAAAFYGLNFIRDVPRENYEAIRWALFQAIIPSFLPSAVSLYIRRRKMNKQKEREVK